MGLDVIKQHVPFWRHRQQFHAFVSGGGAAAQQATAVQPVYNACRGGGIQPHQAGQRALIEAGLTADRQQCAVLHRRDAKPIRFLQKQGHGDLLQPSDVGAGQGFRQKRGRDVGHGLRIPAGVMGVRSRSDFARVGCQQPVGLRQCGLLGFVLNSDSLNHTYTNHQHTDNQHAFNRSTRT
jgi:hypothetical protein